VCFLNAAAFAIKSQNTVNNISISVEVGNGLNANYRAEGYYRLG
jgi:hypothetical protein